MLATKFQVLFPHLDERTRRLLMGAEAQVLGRGGIAMVARAAGVREATVSAGVDELDSGQEPLGRVRRRGGGRKRAADLDPGLVPALLALVGPSQRGDPMSPLLWTTKSTRAIARELTADGHRVSADTVGDLLRAEGFSLQGNAKTLEGRQSPDRDAQFQYINAQVSARLEAGDPVVSVDTKKKELVGPYANRGREWSPKGDPVRVDSHDFPDKDLGKVVPYGIYDLGADTGWVNVGTDHDTAAFAVESLRRWWNGQGHSHYPHTRRLLVTADAGGSNGYRTRAWKSGLAAFARHTGLEITVCHFPPGTSKWNRIEHRLFAHITMNWRARPLTSHDVIIASIGATTTTTGLSVHAELDTDTYPTGIQVSDTTMDALPLTRHTWHGDWNYTLHPLPPRPPAAAPPPARGPEHPDWAHPGLTGLSTPAWQQLLTTVNAAHHDSTTKPGAHYQRALTIPEQTLITVLRHRYHTPQAVLSELFAVTIATIAKAERHTLPHLQQFLHQHHHTIEPATHPLKTLTALTTHAHTHGITLTPKPKPTRPPATPQPP